MLCGCSVQMQMVEGRCRGNKSTARSLLLSSDLLSLQATKELDEATVK